MLVAARLMMGFLGAAVAAFLVVPVVEDGVVACGITTGGVGGVVLLFFFFVSFVSSEFTSDVFAVGRRRPFMVVVRIDIEVDRRITSSFAIDLEESLVISVSEVVERFFGLETAAAASMAAAARAICSPVERLSLLRGW